MAPGGPGDPARTVAGAAGDVSRETSRMFNDRAERPALEMVLASALQLRRTLPIILYYHEFMNG